MSSETSIFKCSLCLAIFNNTIRTPQSLPCGHVFCKACITDYSKTHLTCPLDQTSHPAVDKLPSCINILNNLPKPQYKISFCSIHTKRHIKYRCKIHNVFICSECVIQHAGSGHDLQAFKISPEKIREEIKKLSESTLTLFYDSETALKEYDILDRRILRFYDNQISKVTASFDAAIKSLQIKKSELIDELSKVLREQLANLEEKKLSVIASLERSKEWSLKIQSLSNEIMEITYDEYYKHISEISKQLNLVPKTNPVNFGIKFMVFNDMINLKEMGSISQIKEPL